ARRSRRLRAARRALDEAGAPLRRASDHPVRRGRQAALEARDVHGYEAAYRELEMLDVTRAALRRRQELADRLRAGLPRLADRLAASAGEETWDRRLPTLSRAWNWTRADAW